MEEVTKEPGPVKPPDVIITLPLPQAMILTGVLGVRIAELLKEADSAMLPGHRGRLMEHSRLAEELLKVVSDAIRDSQSPKPQG